MFDHHDKQEDHNYFAPLLIDTNQTSQLIRATDDKTSNNHNQVNKMLTQDLRRGANRWASQLIIILLVVILELFTSCPQLVMTQQQQFNQDNRVINTVGDAKTTFKYHLNHRQPPAPVPITIERAIAQQQRQTLPSSSSVEFQQQQQQAPSSDDFMLTSSSSARLVQLHLPMELHLKLRPLALPAPPPPPTQMAQSQTGKRRRSLSDEQQQLFGWQEAKRVLMINSMASPLVRNHHRLQRRHSILASHDNFVARAQNQLAGHRSISSTPPAVTTTPPPPPTTMASQNNSSQLVAGQLDKRRREDELMLMPTEAQQNILPLNDKRQDSLVRSSGLMAQLNDLNNDIESLRRKSRAEESATSGGEVLPAATNSRPHGIDESQIQALAAAMLPYVWPSFQLTASSSSSASKLKTRSIDSNNNRQLQVTRDPQTPTGWPMQYQQLERNSTPTQSPGETDIAPEPEVQVQRRDLTTVASSTTTTTTTSTTPAPKKRLKPTATSLEKPVRQKKRKKQLPVYLADGARAAGTGSETTSDELPDSARMASRYQMPRIKFNASSLTTGSHSSSPRSQQVTVAPGGGHTQVPKNLVKLIEAQVMMTATNSTNISQQALLKQHLDNLAGNNSTGKRPPASLAPTTSVSKVVRLLAQHPATSEHSALVSSSTLSPARVDLKRIEATTTTTTIKPNFRFETSPRPNVTESSAMRSLQPPTSTAPPTTPPPTTTTQEPTTTSMPTAPAISSTTSSTTTSTTSTPKPEVEQATRVKAKQQLDENQLVGRAQKQKQSKVKLFHFKRKPDMNKLPFYKKPLNFTELGWTPEQIERELALQAAEAAATGSDDGSDSPLKLRNREEEPDADESPVSSTSGQESAALDEEQKPQKTSERHLLLLKRKRRAKNQFERLMAELQAAAAAATSSTTESPTSGGSAPTSGSQSDTSESSELVPVLRKKHEPLVMKPMFFVMNQKRRTSGGDAMIESISNKTSPGETPEVLAPNSTTTPNNSTTLDDQEYERKLSELRNKPIVRMRRKHHGEQPGLPVASSEPLAEAALTSGSSSPWRPSKLNWQRSLAPAPAPAGRLVLVPSGLLTPSGSHPMPLITQPEVVDSFLVAPSSGSVAVANTPPPPTQPQVAQLMSANQASELRVPKLLSKPMRPAKYSLNGYIPKPSLAAGNSSPVQAVASPQPLAGPQSSPLQASTLSGGGGAVAQSVSQQQMSSSSSVGGRLAAQNKQQTRRPAAQSSLLSAANFQPQPQLNKDLDSSSTSNEIFSHRRGLQQQQQQRRAENRKRGSQPSENRLLPVLPQVEKRVAIEGDAEELINLGANSTSSKSPSRQQLQMEENRRKYVKQHQAANKSPAALSLQKVNQIKAKLGLASASGLLTSASSSSSAASSRRHKAQMLEDSQVDSHQSQASDANISTLDPDSSTGSGELQASELAAQVTGSRVAATLGTIPKTNFECTDKRGHFVAGLFADTQTGCQVWHLCSNNRKYSFLCPSGTIFNAKVRICDWRYNVKCE